MRGAASAVRRGGGGRAPGWRSGATGQHGGGCAQPAHQPALAQRTGGGRLPAGVLQAVHERNESQKSVLAAKVRRHFGDDLSGLTFGIWGLAFKPETDDMREAPAIVLLNELVASGARVIAYDPVAMEIARQLLPAAWFGDGTLRLAEHQYAALEGVDSLVLVTEWKPFRHPDFGAMKRMMKQPVIFDGRNQYDPAGLRPAGFTYYGIGR